MKEINIKSLKDRAYYSDLYDRGTVEQCRGMEQIGKELEIPTTHNGHTFGEEEVARMKRGLSEMTIYFKTGERYLHKDEAIAEWMERDRARDELYERAEPPANIRCLTCGSIAVATYKTSHSEGIDKERVLFMYDCPNGCLPRRAFFHDGEEWKPRPSQLCPKCSTKLKEEERDTEEKFVTVSTCGTCDFTKTDELVRSHKEEKKPDPDFAKDGARFCLSEAEGGKYRQAQEQLKQMGKLAEKWKDEEKNKELYDAVAKLKKLKILELESFLKPSVEKEGYAKFELGKPDIGKDVTVGFSAQDAKPERAEYESTHHLQKLIKGELENTNWRLMSEGISYRLGYLTGRLRAYEREEDLLELQRKNSLRA